MKKNFRLWICSGMILAVILSLVFLAVSCTFSGLNTKTAEALKNADVTSKATLIAGGADLWDATNSKINTETVKGIFDDLFGEDDAIEYIKDNADPDEYRGTYNTVTYANYTDADGNTRNAGDYATGNYIVPATTINSRIIDPAKRDYGYVLKINGANWMVSSMTLDLSGNPVVTLYYATYTSHKTSLSSNASGWKGKNMYSSGPQRNTLLNSSTFKFYNEGTFAETYLVQPKNIGYQYSESMVGRSDIAKYSYTYPNEALGKITSGWETGVEYEPDYVYNGSRNARYDAWGSDYVWLPSLTEVGLDVDVDDVAVNMTSTSIWKLSELQRKHDFSPFVWLRSGHAGYTCYNAMAPDTSVTWATGSTCSIRPAIHLNLGPFLRDREIEIANPSDVSITYNGSSYNSLRMLYNSTDSGASAKMSWYNPSYYEKLSDLSYNQKLTTTIYSESGETGGTITFKDAMTRWVKIEMNSAWLSEYADAGRGTIKFSGTPDTSDPDHMESDTVRWIKVIVEQKELALDDNFATDPTTGFPLTPNFDAETQQFLTDKGLDAPTIGWMYIETSSGGRFNIPPRPGAYTAYPVIMDAAGKPIDSGVGNFKLKAGYTKVVDILVAGLPTPTLSVSEVNYDGNAKSFVINGYDPNTMSMVVDSRLTQAADLEYFAINAGRYKITFTLIDPSNTSWEVGGTSEKDVYFVIKPTPVTVTFSAPTIGTNWLWSKDTAPAVGAITLNVSNSEAEPFVEVYYIADGSTVKNNIADLAAFDWSTIGIGTYVLQADIPEGSCNFGIGNTCAQAFEVEPITIDVNSLSFNWLHNGSNATLEADGSFKTVYNTAEHRLTLDPTNLRGQGVAIDANHGVNGYRNNIYTDASPLKSGNYTPYKLEVGLVPLNGYKFAGDAATAVVKLNWVIERATFDFGALSWNHTDVTYDGEIHIIELDGVPAGVNISYSGNRGTTPDDYTAKIVQIDPGNNYHNVDVASLPNKDHPWKITKAVIYLDWYDTFVQTDPNGLDYEVPKLDSKYDEQLVYTYYADVDGAPDTTPVNIADVVVDELRKIPYWVQVAIGSSFTRYYELGDGLNPYLFEVGIDRSAVIVKVTNSGTVYNGNPQAAEFVISGGGAAAVSKSDFSLEYSADNGTTYSADIPVNAGSYLVRFTLNKAGQAITGSNVKPFNIAKADFDTSAVKWEDVRNSDAEYTAPYTYEYGVIHELALSELKLQGVNSNPNEALIITFDPNNKNLIASDANTYTARLIYNYNTNNYNEPALPMVEKVSDEFIFTWEIGKAEVDFSAAHWNYDNNFIFTMTDTGEKEFSVCIEGLSGGAENLIRFTASSVVSAKEVGTYFAEFTINTADPAYGNYTIINENLVVKTLNWTIQPRKFVKPQRTKEVPYNGGTYNVFEELGYEDWQLYFDATIDNVTADEWDPSTFTFTNGSHHVKLQFKTNMNSAVTIGAKDNAYWSDLSKAEYEFDFVIAKTKLNLNGFTVSKTDKVAPTPQFAGTVSSDLWVIEVKDENGNPVSSLEWNTYYVATLKVRPGCEEQAVLMQGGKEIEQAEKKFKTPLNPNIVYTQYDVPTLDKTDFEYAGEQTIPVRNFDSGVMEYTEDSDSTLVSAVGEYKLIIRFKPGVNGAWKSQTNVDQDTGCVILRFSISKAKIKSTATTATWDDSGALPEFKLPDTIADMVELEYEILDSSNNVISDLSTIVAGKKYKIRAKLTNGYEENFRFVDASGQELADPTTSLSFSFTKNTKVIGAPDTPTDNPPKGGSGIPEDFPLWQTIVGGLSILLAAVFTAMIVKNVGKVKQYNEQTKKTKAKAQASTAYASAFGTETLLMGSLGLEARWWSAIALGLLGLAVILFVVMLVTGSKAKKARLAYEAAADEAQQAELERQRKEREEQRLEERRQREEDMKMLMMMMNGRKNEGEAQPGGGNYVPYDNTAQLVTQVVQSLLPAIQGMLPAPSENSSRDHEELVALREQQNRLIEALISERSGNIEYTHVIEPYAEAIDTAAGDTLDEDEEDWEDVEEEDYYEVVDDDGELVPEEPAGEETAVEGRPKMPSNFRIRLKNSSDKNQASYVELKNMLNSYKSITFRMSGRVEKIKYHGDVIAIIGIARKSLKLWMALDPNAFDVNHYHQKDASDKPRYAHVPMLVRIGSDRALKRSKELVTALLEQFEVEPKKRYNEKSLQELAYTLKHNALIKAKQPELLRESIHVHDSDVISNEFALESCLETRFREIYDIDNFESVSLDVLESSFLDGQKVTLDKLKKKGLVSEECNGYTITSGERLSKPLYVVADDFSMPAIKMIVLTGGRAVKLIVPENQAE